MPFGWFVMLYNELGRVLALDQLVLSNAVRMGSAPVMLGTTPGSMMELERLLDRALPLIRPKVLPPPLEIRPRTDDGPQAS